jgi:hypothetical protein
VVNKQPQRRLPSLGRSLHPRGPACGGWMVARSPRDARGAGPSSPFQRATVRLSSPPMLTLAVVVLLEPVVVVAGQRR